MANNKEKDILYGKNFGVNGYSIMGFQWGFNDLPQGGKTPTTAAPMSINNNTVGLGATDDFAWNKTYGCSMDSFLSLVSGPAIVATEANVLSYDIDFRLNGPYEKSFPNISNSNLYKQILINNKLLQQVQFAASRTLSTDASTAVDTHGYTSDVRSIGFRIPQMACGWGKTVGLRPTDPAPSVPTIENQYFLHLKYNCVYLLMHRLL